ncbi:hypothetical protein EAG_09322 [Camponotus floridanus]|uniref:Uncharacterized protein n=1 Tax=Camponotus floridanus TaxID=104421 RepID=E2ALB0_CAMFO|nr:hypothetical protein EAG_09322 [Camponotus floridanus]
MIESKSYSQAVQRYMKWVVGVRRYTPGYMKLRVVESLREKGELRGEDLVVRERRWQEEERWEKIRKSEFNKWYGKVKGKGVPEYLRKGWSEERWQRVARFRLGDDMRGGKYWEREERRKCRVCKGGEETWDHIWKKCTDWGIERGWQEMVYEVLGEEGEGERWMKDLEKMKEGMEEGGRKGSMEEDGVIEKSTVGYFLTTKPDRCKLFQISRCRLSYFKAYSSQERLRRCHQHEMVRSTIMSETRKNLLTLLFRWK